LAAWPQDVQHCEDFKGAPHLLLLTWEDFQHQGVPACEADHGCVDGIVWVQRRAWIDPRVRRNHERAEGLREFF